MTEESMTWCWVLQEGCFVWKLIAIEHENGADSRDHVIQLLSPISTLFSDPFSVIRVIAKLYIDSSLDALSNV